MCREEINSKFFSNRTDVEWEGKKLFRFGWTGTRSCYRRFHRFPGQKDPRDFGSNSRTHIRLHTIILTYAHTDAQSNTQSLSLGLLFELKMANLTNKEDQDSLKVFAPVITHDVTLPNSAKKVPMVMVPVPESRTLMAVPISTLSQLKESQMDALKDEQQARDLLIWNDGIGTLEGCDVRFKINQLGCLELLDSDDESENHTAPKHHAISTNTSQSSNNVKNSQKKAKSDTEPAPIRQISPGSSLLRDGPNSKRLRSSSFFPSKKAELNHTSILLEKLVPKQRLEEIRSNAEQWTIEDVKNFVNSIPGCSGYGELFELQHIDGKSLMYLDQKDLIDVINVKLGPAVKIYHAISLLK